MGALPSHSELCRCLSPTKSQELRQLQIHLGFSQQMCCATIKNVRALADVDPTYSSVWVSAKISS